MIEFTHKLLRQSLLCAFYFFIGFVLLSSYSCKTKDDCTNSTRSEKLDGIENIMLQEPDILDSLLNRIDTTDITPNEQARIWTIKALIHNNNQELEQCIRELEKAEKIFVANSDDYHLNINKLIKAFTFEYLKLDNVAGKLYAECEKYFETNDFEKFKFYASLGILRMSNELKLHKNILIDQIKKSAEQLEEPIYSALFYAALGYIEPNDSLKIKYYNQAIAKYRINERWSSVYTKELTLLFLKFKKVHSENARKLYENFRTKNYAYTPNKKQRLIYLYGDPYLLALQGKNKDAIESALQVLDEAVETKIPSIEADCLKLLEILYRRIGDFRNALFMQDRYDKLKSKEIAERERIQLLALGAHYRFSDLKHDKLALKVKFQNTLLILLTITMISMVVFIMVWFTIKANRYKYRILQLENVDIKDQINNLHNSLRQNKNQKAELVQKVEELKLHYDKSLTISEFLQAVKAQKIKNWVEYEACFLYFKPGWIEKLKQEAPELSPTDIKYCMCLNFNLSNYTISQLCDVGIEAIKSAKKRIRDKLSLDDASEIYHYLKRFE